MLKKLTSLNMTPFIISLSFFMEAVDSTVVNTAIPAMSVGLHVDPVDLKVALISYFLALAVFIPISGWLADKFGSKKIFISALCIFTLSSIACGCSYNLTSLMVARFIQGLGGALGLPIGRLMLIRKYGREKLVVMMGRVVMVGGIGLMLGPAIGGYLTHYLSWHWIFWVNIPIGITAIMLAKCWLEEVPPQPVKPFDGLGFVLFGAALAGLTFGLSALSETTMSDTVAVSVLSGSVLLFIAYTIRSKRQLYPVVNLSLLRLRTFRVSVMGNLISRLGFGGIPFLVPLLLQIGLGFPAQTAGLLLTPTAMAILVVKPLVSPLLQLLGYKRLLIINTLLSGLSIWAFMLIDAHTSLYVIAFLTFSYGCMLSLQYSAVSSLAYADVASADLSDATSILGTVQQLAQSFGVATSAILIRFFSSKMQGPLHLTSWIFQDTFFVLGLLTLLSAFVFLKLKPEDGLRMMG
ncbi:MAG: MDR family MFS transporter [Gammaproteobacteria bacterium]|nr:MDR family MFS transporter [Gammaproteobacteria bacterium]